MAKQSKYGPSVSTLSWPSGLLPLPDWCGGQWQSLHCVKCFHTWYLSEYHSYWSNSTTKEPCLVIWNRFYSKCQSWVAPSSVWPLPSHNLTFPCAFSCLL